MIRKLMLVTLLALAFGASIRPATAQQNISGVVKTTFTDNTGNHDQGYFNVQVTQAAPGSLLWHVLVSFNSAVVGVNPATVNLDSIVVKLLPSPNPPSPGVGELVSSVGNAYVDKGLPSQIVWDAVIGPKVREGDFTAPTDALDNDLPNSQVRQGHAFTGDITLQAGTPTVQGVYFDLTGSGSGNGIYPGAVTPEGASLLLLLPGLIPVAVGLRRRRVNKPAGE